MTTKETTEDLHATSERVISFETKRKVDAKAVDAAAAESARLTLERRQKETDFASVATAHRKYMRETKKELIRLADVYESKTAMQSVQAREVFDYRTKQVRVYAKDNGELLDERTMTGEEVQMMTHGVEPDAPRKPLRGKGAKKKDEAAPAH